MTFSSTKKKKIGKKIVSIKGNDILSAKKLVLSGNEYLVPLGVRDQKNMILKSSENFLPYAENRLW